MKLDLTLQLCRIFSESHDIENFQTYIFNKYCSKSENLVLMHTFLPVPHKKTVIKFEYPLKLPPPSPILDNRSSYAILKDIYAILSSTPSADYKSCVDQLLGRDSGVAEIDENGIELTALEIKEQLKSYKRNDQVQTVLMNSFVSTGPTFFCGLSINGCNFIPALVESGASNSTLSTALLSTFKLKFELDNSVRYVFQNSTEMASDSLLGSTTLPVSFHHQGYGKTDPTDINMLVLNSQLPYVLLGGSELSAFQAHLCYHCPAVQFTIHNKTISLLLYRDTYLEEPYETNHRCKHPSKNISTPYDMTDPPSFSRLSLQNLRTDDFSDNINSSLPPPLFTELSEDTILGKLDESLPSIPSMDPGLLNLKLPPEFSSLENDIRTLLNEYSHLHPRSKQDVGKLPNYEAHLDIKPGSKLPRESPRPMSDAKRRVAASMEMDLLEAGVIEYSDSPYASNSLITEKAVFGVRGSHSKADNYLARMKKQNTKSYDPDKKYRYTVDFRILNRCLVTPPRITLPTESEVARLLQPPNTHLFSCDIANAFHSICYSKDSRHLTAFWNSQRLKMHFTRTSQGVSNSPFFFSDATRPEFQDHKYKEFCESFNYSYDPIYDQIALFLVIYCDDLLMGCNKTNAIQRLHFIFFTLHRLGLKMDFKKMLLFTHQINFLGTDYNILSRTHRMKEDRRISLLSFRQPSSYAELLSRMASYNYTSPYLLGLKIISLPLLRLLHDGRQGRPWRWDLIHQQTWTNLKYLIHLSVELHIPDPHKPLVLITDANKVSASGTIYMLDEKLQGGQQLQLVNTFDKLFSGSSLRYGISKKEFSAVLIAFTRWETLIRNAPYVLTLSDCRALTFVRRMKNTTSTLFESAIFVSSFMNVVFGYIPGVYLKLADQLTRQWSGSEINIDVPKQLLAQMPPSLRPAKHQTLTPDELNQVIWSDITIDKTYIDISNYKDIIKNPPVNIETEIQDLLSAPSEESFINFLLSPITSAPVTSHPRLKNLSKTKLGALSHQVQRDRIQNEIRSLIHNEQSGYIQQAFSILKKSTNRLTAKQVEKLLIPFQHKHLSEDLRQILSSLKLSPTAFCDHLVTISGNDAPVLPIFYSILQTSPYELKLKDNIIHIFINRDIKVPAFNTISCFLGLSIYSLSPLLTLKFMVEDSNLFAENLHSSTFGRNHCFDTYLLTNMGAEHKILTRGTTVYTIQNIYAHVTASSPSRVQYFHSDTKLLLTELTHDSPVWDKPIETAFTAGNIIVMMTHLLASGLSRKGHLQPLQIQKAEASIPLIQDTMRQGGQPSYQKKVIRYGFPRPEHTAPTGMPPPPPPDTRASLPEQTDYGTGPGSQLTELPDMQQIDDPGQTTAPPQARPVSPTTTTDCMDDTPAIDDEHNYYHRTLTTPILGAMPDDESFSVHPDLSPSYVPDIKNSLLLLSRIMKNNLTLRSQDMFQLQKTDTFLNDIIENIEQHHDFVIENGVLIKLLNKNRTKLKLICFPRSFLLTLIHHLHSVQEMHLPDRVLNNYLFSLLYVPGKASEHKQLFRQARHGCLKCFLTTLAPVKQYRLSTRSVQNLCPGELLNIDIISNLPLALGKSAILLVSDEASSYVFGLTIATHLFDEIYATISNFFQIVPHPRFLRFDFEPGFRAINQYAEEHGVCAIKSTPRASNEAGQVESSIGLITRTLKRIVSSTDLALREKWPLFLAQALSNVNFRSPYEKLYSRQELYYSPAHYFPFSKIDYSEYSEQINQMLSNLQEIRRSRSTSSRNSQKYANIRDIYLQKGTFVKLRVPDNIKPTTAGSKKILNDFSDIFRVLSTRPTSFQLQNIFDGTERVVKKTLVTALDKDTYSQLPQILASHISPGLIWLKNFTSRKKNLAAPEIQFQTLLIKKSSAAAVRSSRIKFGNIYIVEFSTSDPPNSISKSDISEKNINFNAKPLLLNIFQLFHIHTHFNMDVSLTNVRMAGSQ